MQAVRILRPLARAPLAARAFSTSRVALREGPLVLADRSKAYAAKALAIGEGRNGTTQNVDADVPVTLQLSTPKAMGGKGAGQNPEELFAMGYAACFLGALQFVAAKQGKKEAAAHAKIHSKVFLGTPASPPTEGFGLAIELTVEGVSDKALIDAAHEFCPYSRLARYGAEVSVTVKGA